MTCLQLCVLFNVQICGTFPLLFIYIFLGRGPCTNALLVLLFRGHGEFETGLLQCYTENIQLCVFTVYLIPFILLDGRATSELSLYYGNIQQMSATSNFR